MDTADVKEPPAVRIVPKVAPPKVQALPRFHVVLLDDDLHTYEYVIDMLRRLFGHPTSMGRSLARQVDSQGRAIVMTTHEELAELKRDQIRAFGADWRIANCNGSMAAIVIRAPD